MSLSLPRLRILRTQPLAIALTWAPSNGAPSRFSVQMICESRLSHRQPSGETMRSMVLRMCSSSWNCTSTGLIDPDVTRAVDHDFGYLGVPKQLRYGADRSRSSAINLAAWSWTASPSSGGCATATRTTPPASSRLSANTPVSVLPSHVAALCAATYGTATPTRCCAGTRDAPNAAGQLRASHRGNRGC